MTFNANLPRGTNPTFQTGANNANPLIPIEFQRAIIANATQMSVCGRLMQHMPMSSQLKEMPVLSTKPTAFFMSNADSGLIQTTTLAWKNVQMTAEEIAVMVPIPVNVVSDINYDIWAKIRPEIEEAIAVALDAAILFGTNKPSSWPSDIKTAAISAGNTVTQGAGIDVAADINNVLASVEADGFTPMQAAMRQSLRASLRGLRSTTNEFIFPGDPTKQSAQKVSYADSKDAVDGLIMNVPTVAVLNGTFEAEDTASANACEYIVGDWSQAILGIREDVTVDFSKDAIITDGNGDIQFNAWQQRGIIGRFIARYGYAVPNPVTRLRASEGSRYPFGILRDAA